MYIQLPAAGSDGGAAASKSGKMQLDSQSAASIAQVKLGVDKPRNNFSIRAQRGVSENRGP